MSLFLKMSIFKKLLKDTALYGVSSMLGRLLTYLLVPLHTHLYYGFSKTDFGIMTVLYAYMAFLNIVYTYGMETTFFRYTKKNDETNGENKSNAQEIFNIIFSYLCASTLFFTVVFWVFSGQIAYWLGYPSKSVFIQYLAVILAIDTILALPFAKLRFENKAKNFALYKIFNIVLTVLLNVVFLIIFKEISKNNPIFVQFLQKIGMYDLGIGYVLLANLWANALTLLFFSKTFFAFRFNFNTKQFGEMFIYAYPLLFMGLAGTVNSMVDKILLEKWLPVDFYVGQTATESVGVYGAGLKLAIFMNLAIQAFKYTAEPFFFSKAQDKNSPQLFAQVMHYFVIACVIIWVGVCVNLDILKVIFLRNPAYHAGVAVVPMLLFANLLLGIYFNLTVWFKLTDRTYFGTYIAFVGAVITILGNIALIPVWGYMGCAMVAVLTYTVMCLLCVFYGEKYYPIPYDWQKIFFYIIFGFVLILISFYLKNKMDFWLEFLVQNAIFGVFCGVAFLRERSPQTPKRGTNSI